MLELHLGFACPSEASIIERTIRIKSNRGERDLLHAVDRDLRLAGNDDLAVGLHRDGMSDVIAAVEIRDDFSVAAERGIQIGRAGEKPPVFQGFKRSRGSFK